MEEAERLERDRANNHPTEGGLFGGLFKPKAPPLQPVIDIDDGVARCPHCAWELEDGVNCAGCGYRYRPHSVGTDDSADYSDSDLDSLDGMEDLDGDGNSEDDYADPYGNEFTGPGSYEYTGPGTAIFDDLGRIMSQSGRLNIPLHPGGFLASGNTNGSEYDEEDEEENEYDESDSFIDAENDHVPTSSFIDTEGHYLGSASESERGTATVVDDDHSDGPPRPIGLDYRTNAGYFDDEASDDEQEEEEVSGETSDGEEDEEVSDEPEDAIRTAPSRRAFPQHSQRPPWFEATWLSARAPTVIPDSDDLVETSEASASSPPVRAVRSIGRRPTQHGNNPRNAITLDDSDEDQPVGPMRRATQRRRARFSPY
jgi:hypothetical protein